MKKLLLVLFVLGVAFYQADAQSCSKAKTAAAKKECAKKCTKKSAKQTKVASVSAEAILAAEQSEDVESKTCGVSGKTSFYKKSVCEKSGKVSTVEVEYDADNKEFVDVASASMEAELVEEVEAEVEEVKTEVKETKSKSCAKMTAAEKKACAKKCSDKCAKDCCKGKKAEMDEDKT